MNYLDNDFLIPVILADGKEAYRVACFIYESTSIRPYIFAHRFSLLQRLLFKCKRILYDENFTTVYDLCNFASKMESRGSLLLVYSSQYRGFIQSNSDEIESRYVAVELNQLINSYKETN